MSFSIRKGLLSLAAVGAVLGGTLLVAPAAQAAPSDCPSGSACNWRDASYVTSNSGGALVAFSKYIPDYSTWTFKGTSINANDNSLSFYNNGNYETTYYYTKAYPTAGTTARFALAKKTGDGNITNSDGLVSGQSNTISSGYFSSLKP